MLFFLPFEYTSRSTMSFPITSDRFGPLIEFISTYQESLLEDPLNGQIEAIWGFFLDFSTRKNYPVSVRNSSGFFRLLVEFNIVSGGALLFSEGSIPKLEWIKLSNVLHLEVTLKNNAPTQKQISNEDPAPISASTPDSSRGLLELLTSSAKTRNEASNDCDEGFDHDLDRLKTKLAQETAIVTLGIQRAQIRTSVKPFFEVCESQEHSQSIANLCLNSRTLNSSFHDLPTNSKLHKTITSYKSVLNKDTFECSKCKIHFLPLVTSNTDLYLGNCSYLDTCHKLKSCRYLHYYTLNPLPSGSENVERKPPPQALDFTLGECYDTTVRKETPSQWINCDVRYLPFEILGKFAAIISDPAWDIHMSLPYGTCKDSELLSLPMPKLQDEGILMLWVTGRSIEIGRKALEQWGYTVSDEMIWIKINQLRKTIVTGRTGHWLNHSKEHLLVGVKGNPIWLNRKIDIDFIVSGTRETSRKPDELYGIVERIVGKHSRKLEIFGRDNNVRPGWLTIGNQLTGTSIYEEEVKQKYNKYQASLTKNTKQSMFGSDVFFPQNNNGNRQ